MQWVEFNVKNYSPIILDCFFKIFFFWQDSKNSFSLMNSFNFFTVFLGIWVFMFVYISLGFKLFIEMQIFLLLVVTSIVFTRWQLYILNCHWKIIGYVYWKFSFKSKTSTKIDKNMYKSKCQEIRTKGNSATLNRPATYAAYTKLRMQEDEKTSDPSHSHSLLPLSFLLSLFSFFFSFLSRYCAHIILVHAPVLLCAFFNRRKAFAKLSTTTKNMPKFNNKLPCFKTRKIYFVI